MIENSIAVIPALVGIANVPPPDPLGYPVPPWVLLGLSYLTLTLHLLAMNFTIGGALLFLWMRFRRRPGHAEAGRFFGSSLPLGVSYTITLGIPPLLFAQVVYGQLFYSSSVLIGAFWIQVIPVLMLAYAGFYYHKLTRDTRPRAQVPVVAISVLLLMYIGYIYVNNFTLAMSPGKWGSIYAAHPAGGVLHHGEPTVHPRYLLFLSGAFAAAGVALIWRGAYFIKWDYVEEGRRSQSLGFRAALLTPIAGFAAAVGIYAARPADISAMWSSGGTVIALLAIGIICAFLAGICAYRAIGKGVLTYPILSSLGMAGVMGCMVVFRDMVRMRELNSYFTPWSVPVNAQWGMFTLFVLTLAAGSILLLILGMKVLPKSAAEARERLSGSPERVRLY